MANESTLPQDLNLLPVADQDVTDKVTVYSSIRGQLYSITLGRITSGGATGDVDFREEGVSVVTGGVANFVGDGVTVTDVAGVATVTIPGGGGSGTITGSGTSGTLTRWSGTSAIGNSSGVVNTDIAAGAAIADSKLAQITTASKVSTAALTGTVASTNLGTGTANSTTYLRGDGTWATPGGGGTVTGTGTTNKISKWGSTSGQADSSLSDDGTTLTGTLPFAMGRAELRQAKLVDPSSKLTALGSVSGAQAHSLATAPVVSLTMSGNTTLTLSGAPASGQSATVTAIVTGNGTAVLTLAGGTINYPAGTPTVQTNGEKRYYQATTEDGGTTYTVFYSGGAALPLAGGTLTGELITLASSTTTAGLNVPHGAAPTAPVNGDVWTTTAGMYVRTNGATVGPLAVSGGGSAIITKDEGTQILAASTALNFVGAGVVATDGGSGVTTVTIAGGGGGGVATRPISLGHLLSPDSSGKVFPQSASILDTNDLFPTTGVLVFAATGTKDSAYCRFRLPDDYVSAAKFYVRYKTTVTSGNVLWMVEYCAIAVGETGDPATVQTTLSGTATAVPGTTNLIASNLLTATDADFAAGDEVYVRLSRNGAGADTASASMQLLDLVFSYSVS